MTIDLSNNPTPMRTRDGRRADFKHYEGTTGRHVYDVEYVSDFAFLNDGSVYNGAHQVGIDLIGPWWVVGETYLHDGGAENPLPKDAKCWRHYPNCIVSGHPGEGDLASWANVVAYTITELPEAKLSVADELRELIVLAIPSAHLNELGYTSSLRAKVAALADRLDKEDRGNE